MDNNPLHILLVEDNPTDVLLLTETLEEVRTAKFVFTHAKRLDEALRLLHDNRYDVLLLDLGLPDSQGLDTFSRMQREHPELPILILSGLDDDALDVRAVQDGAQDFLVKGKINGGVLARTITYAIERKRTERKLLASEVGYRRLFETAQDGIFILDDATGQITDANPYLQKFLGYPITDFIGKRLWEIAPFRDKRANKAAFQTLQKEDFIRYDDLPLLTRDGKQVDVEFTSNIYEVGSLRVIQCNIRDIRERKQAEAIKQEAQRFLQSTLDALSSHIAVLDEAGEIIAVNKAWQQFSSENQGTAISCGVGANYLEVCERASGVWEEEAPAIVQGIREVMAGRHQAFCLEYPCHSPNEERWFTVCVTHFVGEGPVRVVVAHENITQRKQAEETLRASEANLAKAQEIGHVGSWELDLSNLEDISKNHFLHWSDEVFRIFGYQPSEVEISYESFIGTVHPDDRATATTALTEAVRGGRPYSIEHRIILPKGGERWVHRNSAILLDESGKPVKMMGIVQDITERKLVEDALRESEQRFQSMVGNVPGTVYQYVSKPDGSVEIPFVNEGCRELFEMEPQELQRNPNFPVEVIHPDDRLAQERSVIESMKSLTPWSCEWRMRLPTGKTKWVQGAGRPRRLPDGSTLWDGLLMDITARKEAEAERDRFFTLSLDMLAIIGIDGYMKRLNPAFEATLGFSKAELKAVPFMEFIHPDDVARTLEGMTALERGDQLLRFENRYRCLDGSYKWLQWMIAPFEDLWYCVAHDITDIKQAEAALHKANDELELRVMERTTELQKANEYLRAEFSERQRAVEAQQESYALLHSVTEGTTDCIFVKDLQGRYLMINSAGALRRKKTVAQVVGKLDTDLFSPETARIIMEADHRVLAADATQTFEETTVDNGVTRTHLVTKGPHRNPRGEVVGIVGIARDITARHQQEEALRIAKEEADTANMAKSEFLSRMSHELRTPLNAILGFGQILEMEDLSPLSKESVGYILKGGRHLLDLINEVLDIARVEAGHVDLSLEPIALDDVVPDACTLVWPLAAERNIRLEENTSEMGGSHILADRQRLKQVLINLLSNAIKYNRESGGVEVACERKPDGWTAIAIRDTGPGIASQDLSKLFTPFERLGANGSEVEGTGLGLALSQRLVTAMGGTLRVESTLGQGTTFIIEFPQATSPVEQLADLLEVPFALDTSREIERTYSILCIEDNSSNLRLMEAILRSRPEISLLAAMQGSVGLELARQQEPDLILLDLNLPDIHGSEVLSRLQESALTKEIPVVVISADATAKQIERLLTGGAKVYLTKPLNVEQFLHTLDEFLHHTPTTKVQPNYEKEFVN